MTGTRLGDAVHIGTWEPGTPEWNEARRDTINGSEIAAVLGISPYDSPFSLWHRKAGRIGEVEQSDEMYWGNQLEPVIRDEFNRRHQRAFAPSGLFRHHERMWQGGGPDGIDDGELLECKTARYDEGWGEPGSDQIPVHYRAQCLWYLDVFGYQVCHVAVLIAGSEFREYRIKRDDAELVPMRAAATAFLETLRAGQAPPLDGHEATYQAMRELHPDIEPGRVDLPAAIALPYLQAVAAAKDAEAEKRHRAAAVLDAMGSVKDAFYLNQRIASRQAKSLEPDCLPYLVAARGVADQFRSAA